jgi:hypothetical protein
MRQTRQIFQDLGYFSFIYLACALFFVCVFRNSDIFAAFKAITSIFYLFLLPGFVIMELFVSLDFIERFVLGGIVGYTLVTIIAYYLNVLAYLSLRHIPILPPILIALAVIAKLFLNKRKEQV